MGRFGLSILICILMLGCQSAHTPTPQPTPSIPISTLYFSETPLEGAELIEGMVIVASPEEFYRCLNDNDIKIIYFDQTSIDQITDQSLSIIYQNGIIIVSFDTPLSMLAKKSGHPQKMIDLELRKPQAYFSSVYQRRNKLKSFNGEFSDFTYDNFVETHRRINIQRMIGICTVGLAQPLQCAEFQ